MIAGLNSLWILKYYTSTDLRDLKIFLTIEYRYITIFHDIPISKAGDWKILVVIPTTPLGNVVRPMQCFKLPCFSTWVKPMCLAMQCTHHDGKYLWSLEQSVNLEGKPWGPNCWVPLFFSGWLWMLVGGIPTPLKNISQMGWWHSQYMGKIIQMFRKPSVFGFLMQPFFRMIERVGHELVLKERVPQRECCASFSPESVCFLGQL